MVKQLNELKLTTNRNQIQYQNKKTDKKQFLNAWLSVRKISKRQNYWNSEI